MKKLFIVATLISSTSWSAEYIDRKELWFFGAKGIISGGLNLEYQHSDVKIESNPSVKANAYGVDYDIYYGITDAFKVGLSPTYQYIKPDGSKSSSGFVEPAILASYRLFTPENCPLFVDANLEMSPAWGEHGSNDQMRGNTKVIASISAGQVFENFAYKLTPALAYSTVSHNENAPDTDARFDIILNAESQYNLDKKFSLLANIGITLPGELKTSATNVDYDALVSFEPGVKYAVIDELSVSVLGKYTYGKGSIDSTTVGGNKDITANDYGVSALVNFGF